MILSTRRKIAAARLAWRGVTAVRGAIGLGRVATVRRGGLRWALDLDEGIDFAIWLTGAFEPRTAAALRRLVRPGDTVLDIGANMGAHTLPLAKAVGAEGRVHAFEPTAAAFGRLSRNIALNPDLAGRIVPVQAMLSAATGGAPPAGVYASWPLSENNDPAAHPLHLGVARSTEGARALALDDYLAEAGAGRVALVKLDVDGWEPEVLQGAAALLARDAPPVVMEIAPYVLEERGHEPDAAVAILARTGYGFTDLAGRKLADGIGALIGRLAPGESLNVIARRA